LEKPPCLDVVKRATTLPPNVMEPFARCGKPRPVVETLAPGSATVGETEILARVLESAGDASVAAITPASNAARSIVVHAFHPPGVTPSMALFTVALSSVFGTFSNHACLRYRPERDKAIGHCGDEFSATHG
jgi:hypothetical protein